MINLGLKSQRSSVFWQAVETESLLKPIVSAEEVPGKKVELTSSALTYFKPISHTDIHGFLLLPLFDLQFVFMVLTRNI